MSNIQHRFVGAGPPSVKPEGVGHHYIDTTNKISYTSVGVDFVSDWNTDVGISGINRVENDFIYTPP